MERILISHSRILRILISYCKMLIFYNRTLRGSFLTSPHTPRTVPRR